MGLIIESVLNLHSPGQITVDKHCSPSTGGHGEYKERFRDPGDTHRGHYRSLPRTSRGGQVGRLVDTEPDGQATDGHRYRDNGS